MKQCLICQASEDQASLLRLPVSIEGQPLGDFLVCSGCIDLLGKEQVASLVRSAAMEGAYQPSQIIGNPAAESGDSSQDGADAPSPRTLTASLPASALANEKTFAAWLGAQLAPLLLGQYRQGRGQVTMLTSLTQDNSLGNSQENTDYQFRVILGD